MTLWAGAAKVDITPPLGVPLMGYGARNGRATAVADRIHARALSLESHSGHPVLVVSAELCLMTSAQAGELRERIAARTGLPREAILVACTHTHSGPDTGVGERNAARPEPAHVAALFEGIVAAGEEAWRHREPATLAWSRSEAHIGRNRRVADGEVDTGLEALRVATPGAKLLAVLFRHSCHGTVRGHDSLEISGDWPGAASRRIEAETGAVAPFLLGAHADVDPRTRGLMDLAIPGQSVGLGAEAVRVLGGEVADAVLASLSQARPELESARVVARSARVKARLHLGHLSEAECEAELARRKAELASHLGVPLAQLPRTSALYDFASESARALPVEAARERIALVRTWLRDRTAPFFSGGRRELEVEVQLLAIGQALLLALPLEPTTAVGRDWRERVAPLGLGLVVGIGNGWLRYLPHASDLAHPRAHQHYEVLQSLFAPGTCESLLAAGSDLARELEEAERRPP
ncbi:MAG TPA: neutral/alkaline non-lysosomal ceramidase N-terminal domain-containing protein [Myxococcota bacterium]|nr:neutral/alkaline non-lysosomal ceramidase N-terminal domain-containing protein [Myxococcota bacterium]